MVVTPRSFSSFAATVIVPLILASTTLMLSITRPSAVESVFEAVTLNTNLDGACKALQISVKKTRKLKSLQELIYMMVLRMIILYFQALMNVMWKQM